MARISLCIPTFNGESYVGAALSSVLAQVCEGLEVLVVDDASADNTPARLAEFNDPRLRIFHNPTRLGLVGNWNRCLELAGGDYVQIFHQDDMLLSGAVAGCVAVLDAHPQVGFVFGNIVTTDPQGQPIGGHWNPVLPTTDTLFCGHDLLRLLLRHGNLIPCQTVMLRADCYRALGGFDPRLRYTPDLEMWLRLCLHYDAAYIAQPLAHLRRHAGQVSAAFLGQAREVEEVRRAYAFLFTEWAEDVPDSAENRALALAQLRAWTRQLARRAVRQNAWSALPALAGVAWRLRWRPGW